MDTYENNIIIRMFEWWNRAMAGTEPLRTDSFGQFYTSDARLIVNGALRCQTLEEMAIHYAGIRVRCDQVHMVLPVTHAFHTTDNAFVHCQTVAVIEGEQTTEDAMAYAHLRNGLMASLEVIGRAA